MKSSTLSLASRKPLMIAALVSMMLGAGLAQADGRSCLFDQPAPQANTSQSFAYPQEVRQQMARIETALRSGQITPFEAGQLMRQQWEIAQFQRGFLASGAPGIPAATQPAASGGCGLGLGLGPELGGKLGAKIGPLVGDMAKNGMQTASTVMRAIRRETERLLMEELPAESPEL